MVNKRVLNKSREYKLFVKRPSFTKTSALKFFGSDNRYANQVGFK